MFNKFPIRIKRINRKNVTFNIKINPLAMVLPTRRLLFNRRHLYFKQPLMFITIIKYQAR